MLGEIGMEKAFRRTENWTSYQKSAAKEKFLKSSVLLIFAALLFNRPAVEGTISVSILMVWMAVAFYYSGLYLRDKSLILHLIVAVLTAIFAVISVLALITTYLVIS